MTTPKATVLISTYNRPRYLREAVASVVDQKMADWELIVLNDGGEDVGDVIAEFNDPRIRYFPDDENKGAACRFNQGLRAARAEYITYLGDDDHFYPNHLEVLTRALDENPDLALAYSDLYAVSCLVDEESGRRFVLDKQIKISRDFNRDFMFFYNHVLHVSLMHRKKPALAVGAFDERVKVLIEWSLNRRLCFNYDFLHIQEVTGEYFMPIFKSDRISVVQRKNKEEYRHNLRKIRTNLPPEPWGKVRKIDFICPVNQWTPAVPEMVGGIIDHIDHPIRIRLINNEPGRTEEQARESLGLLSELNSISIHTPPRPLDGVDVYRWGAEISDADYVFLLTRNLQIKTVPKRIFGGLECLDRTDAAGVKWNLPEENRTGFDLLVDRERFLSHLRKYGDSRSMEVYTITNGAPASFAFDAHFSKAKRQAADQEYDEALKSLKRCLELERGAPRIQLLIKLLTECCLKLGELDLAEREIRTLIERGYEPDNWIRLGWVLQKKRDFAGAVEAYQNGLDKLGLTVSDLDHGLFPLNFPKELGAFNAMIGLAECLAEQKDRESSMRMYRLASRLRANSHRPFLGFAKHYLADNQLDLAEGVMSKVARNNGGSDPETHRVLGRLSEKRKRRDLAFDCYVKACEIDPSDELNLDPLYYTGASLGRWDELRRILEELVNRSPHSVKGLTRLAQVCLEQGESEKAASLVEHGLSLDPDNKILKALERKAHESEAAGRPVSGSETSLSERAFL